MNHPFGDLLIQYLYRKRGLSQAKLAAGILQLPSIISEMSQDKRLRGAQVGMGVQIFLQQDLRTQSHKAHKEILENFVCFVALCAILSALRKAYAI